MTAVTSLAAKSIFSERKPYPGCTCWDGTTAMSIGVYSAAIDIWEEGEGRERWRETG